MEAFVACTLVPLDKNPGVRPIGIGEVLRRIVGKVVMNEIKSDVLEAAGNLQLCAGQFGGREAAVHATTKIFQDDETQAVLLIDASNEFNRINRSVMLHNIGILCPSLAKFAENCYTQKIRLFVIGGRELSSTEGTTQGDPIAMALYGIGILPLMSVLKQPGVKQITFADDLNGAGKINSLHNWWNNLLIFGSKIGYFPEPSKSWLIVKSEKLKEAEQVFNDSKVNITCDGREHLGATVGSNTFKESYVTSKVDKWMRELAVLSMIAKTQPQAAYVAFITGFRHKFNYIFRTIDGIQHLLQPIENIIRLQLIPALCDGRNCSDDERKLLSLPIKLGGMGIINVLDTAQCDYETSIQLTSKLKDQIVNQSEEFISDDNKKTSRAIKAKKLAFDVEALEKLREKMTSSEKKANDIA